MDYSEFNKYTEIKLDGIPFCRAFEDVNKHTFIIEPLFYSQLIGFKRLVSASDFERIMEAIENIIKKNKKVIFTENYLDAYTNLVDYIYLEIHDITDPLCIFIEDKSRGSDYGD